MDRASKHCLRARISICHTHIKTSNNTVKTTTGKCDLKALIDDATSALTHFLDKRTQSVQENIKAWNSKKIVNLKSTCNQNNNFDKNNWVVNLSSKPLSPAERSLLKKGPRFAPTPSMSPQKNIVAEIEAAMHHLPDDTKDTIRTTSATIIHRARPPLHKISFK